MRKSLSHLAVLGAATLLALGLVSQSPIAAKAGGQSLGSWLGAQGYAAVPLRRLASGHQIAAVELNGRSANFIVDSGAGGTVVDRGQLNRFGIPGSIREGTGIGAGGSILVSLHPVKSFRIGGRALPMSQIVSTDLGYIIAGLNIGNGTQVSGVLGQDVLTRYSGVIDVKGQVLYLKLP